MHKAGRESFERESVHRGPSGYLDMDRRLGRLAVRISGLSLQNFISYQAPRAGVNLNTGL